VEIFIDFDKNCFVVRDPKTKRDYAFIYFKTHKVKEKDRIYKKEALVRALDIMDMLNILLEEKVII